MSRKSTSRKEAELACKIVELVEGALEETADLNMCIVQRYCQGMLNDPREQHAVQHRADMENAMLSSIGRQL